MAKNPVEKPKASTNNSTEPDKEHLKDILLKQTEIHYQYIGNYHSQRSVISNILVLSYAAILAFIGFDKTLNILDIPLILVMMVLNIFGAVISWKYYERTRLLNTIYKGYRNALDREVLNSPILKTIEDDAEIKHHEKYPRLRKWKEDKTEEKEQKNEEDNKKRKFWQLDYWEWLRLSSLWVVFHSILLVLTVALLLITIVISIKDWNKPQQNVLDTQPTNTPSATPIPSPTLTPIPAATITSSPAGQTSLNSNQTTPNSNVDSNREN